MSFLVRIRWRDRTGSLWEGGRVFLDERVAKRFARWCHRQTGLEARGIEPSTLKPGDNRASRLPEST
jgi:hypothetical protein